tara:strand:+ start:8921 stop:9142 length:222 start_codon:yes stop_codon:yes gene_type:complete
MDISVLTEPVDGMLNVNVNLYEYTQDKGKSIDVNIWVPASDSRSEISKLAHLAALELLKKAVVALEAEISKPT